MADDQARCVSGGPLRRERRRGGAHGSEAGLRRLHRRPARRLRPREARGHGEARLDGSGRSDRSQDADDRVRRGRSGNRHHRGARRGPVPGPLRAVVGPRRRAQARRRLPQPGRLRRPHLRGRPRRDAARPRPARAGAPGRRVVAFRASRRPGRRGRGRPAGRPADRAAGERVRPLRRRSRLALAEPPALPCQPDGGKRRRDGRRLRRDALGRQLRLRAPRRPGPDRRARHRGRALQGGRGLPEHDSGVVQPRRRHGGRSRSREEHVRPQAGKRGLVLRRPAGARLGRGRRAQRHLCRSRARASWTTPRRRRCRRRRRP